jgi:hypothetical protein
LVIFRVTGFVAAQHSWDFLQVIMSKRKHVFISHHHADDEHVTKLTDMLNRNGYELRNSSIRAKPANQARLDRGEIPEATLKRLLRMKISWASTVVVLIGKETQAVAWTATKSRPWVDWEIRKALELGKRIVGVYTRGGTEADVPEALNDYEDARVNWNSDSIIDAIEGTVSPFEDPGGSEERQPIHEAPVSSC